MNNLVEFLGQFPSALVGAAGTVLGAIIGGILGWRGRILTNKQSLGRYTRREAQMLVAPWARIIASAEYMLNEGVILNEEQLLSTYIAIDQVSPKVSDSIRGQMLKLRRNLKHPSRIDKGNLEQLRGSLLKFCKTYSMVAKNADRKSKKHIGSKR